MTDKLPLAQTPAQVAYWNKLQPVNRVATTDTYKRTMSGSSDLFANNFAIYNLAARKPMQENGANGRYVMAGIEKILYPWFANPITKQEVEDAKEFFTQKGAVKKFPQKAWQAVLDNDGYMPVDIYALPGGQTFLSKDSKYVPMMSVEGVGAIASHLEPQMLTAFAPIMQATKARLFYEKVKDQFAEFGLRSDDVLNNHPTLMMALKVGGGFSLTSDDQAAFLFPEYFKDVGTVGHEFLMAYQKAGTTLEVAQANAFDAFVAQNQRSALLPDVIGTLESGLPEIIRQILKNPDKTILPRFDSGDVPIQCAEYRKMALAAGIPENDLKMIVEDGYDPTKAARTQYVYKLHDGNPNDIIVGAGGYFQEGVTRDAMSLAYKRSATMHETGLEASIKFSDTPGKSSLPGKVRVYGKGDTIIVAQADEKIDGEPLMQKVVDNGRIVYNEDLYAQHLRAKATWDQYQNIEYSPKTRQIMEERFAEKQRIVEKVRK